MCPIRGLLDKFGGTAVFPSECAKYLRIRTFYFANKKSDM